MTLHSDLAALTREVLEAHWRPEGFTVPNAATYPFRWLWDSCFHAIIWAELGEADRAVAELRHVFEGQHDDGFVPHIAYGSGPNPHADFWGQPGYSSITQPPMYGHAIAELVRRGIAVPDELVAAADRGLRYFTDVRRHPSGLVAARHPWETGCDDSPRFDHWGCADVDRWRAVKGELVQGLPANGFDCAPVSLTALVAWNRQELAGATGAGAVAEVEPLVDTLVARWDGAVGTWVDGGAAESTSGRARTLDGLLPLLVDPRPEVLADLVDPAAFGGPFGPAGVHRDEPTFDRRRYWRGPVWPQLAYLVWRGGAQLGHESSLGAWTSGLAEFWDPDDGTGLGAVPQSWTGLALLMAGTS